MNKDKSDPREEEKVFAKNEYEQKFPALPKNAGKPVTTNEYNENCTAMCNSDTSCAMVYNNFPELDTQILGYVLSFCPASDAIPYLKEKFPDKYVENSKGAFKPYSVGKIKPIKPLIPYKQHEPRKNKGISGKL